jgi:hypothetical protein
VSGRFSAGRSGWSPLALGGWVVAAGAVAALVWTRLHPVAAPAAPPAVAVADAPAPVELPVPSGQPMPPTAGNRAEESLETMVARGIAAVVVVETPRGRGSAFYVGPDTLLTNQHVVAGNAYVTLRKANGETDTAFVVASAPDFDLAVLKLSSSALAPAPASLVLGSAAGLRPGQEVVAIGSPLGLRNTVTRGIVSGIRQMGPVTVVQTDAAINPGNSGGPLLDRAGRVVGINSFMVTSAPQQGAPGASQGLNFAVAIDHARALLEGRPPASAALAADPGNSLARPAPVSESDREQAQGGRLLEARLAQLARAADNLDDAWARLLAGGFQGRVEGTYERGWYAVWTEGALQGRFQAGGAATYARIHANAENLKRLALAADEDARRAGVLPGVRRELREKYRLTCPGWGL